MLHSNRSEGEAERGIGSTCMIGPGLVVEEKSSPSPPPSPGDEPKKTRLLYIYIHIKI